MANSAATVTPVIVGSGKVVHGGINTVFGLSVECGAVRYRNTTAASIRKIDAEVTCTKCIAKGHVVAPAAPVKETRKPSHGHCGHAQTPAARRACRKARKAAAK